MGIMWYHLGSRRVVEARRATYGFYKGGICQGGTAHRNIASVSGVGALTALG